jgi:hypothetical protein
MDPCSKTRARWRCLLGAQALASALFLTGCLYDQTHPPEEWYGPAQAEELRLAIQSAVDAKQYTKATCRIGSDDSNEREDVPFLLFPGELQLEISASCKDSSGKMACAAFYALLGAWTEPGVSPHEEVDARAQCQYVNSVFAPGECCHTEQFFCRFIDGSVIFTWSFISTPAVVIPGAKSE